MCALVGSFQLVETLAGKRVKKTKKRKRERERKRAKRGESEKYRRTDKEEGR